MISDQISGIMKFFLILFLAGLCSVTTVVAQDTSFHSGDKVLNLGIGIGTSIYAGDYYTTSVPPVSASFEVGVKDGVIDKGSIGAGGYLAYSAHKWESAGWGWKYSSVFIAARGIFHYPLVGKMDTYTGIALGLNISNSTEYGNPIPGDEHNATSGGVLYAWYLGGRYYFNKNFSAMAELGVGIVYLNLGAAFKF